jgi:hypothetical protein
MSTLKPDAKRKSVHLEAWSQDLAVTAPGARLCLAKRDEPQQRDNTGYKECAGSLGLSKLLRLVEDDTAALWGSSVRGQCQMRLMQKPGEGNRDRLFV